MGNATRGYVRVVSDIMAMHLHAKFALMSDLLQLVESLKSKC